MWWMAYKVCNEWGYVTMFYCRSWWLPLLPDAGMKGKQNGK
jgi:hypothetical protein